MRPVDLTTWCRVVEFKRWKRRSDALGREGYSQGEHRLSLARIVLLMTVRNDGKMMREKMKDTQTWRKKWESRGRE